MRRNICILISLLTCTVVIAVVLGLIPVYTRKAEATLRPRIRVSKVANQTTTQYRFKIGIAQRVTKPELNYTISYTRRTRKFVDGTQRLRLLKLTAPPKTLAQDVVEF